MINGSSCSSRAYGNYAIQNGRLIPSRRNLLIKCFWKWEKGDICDVCVLFVGKRMKTSREREKEREWEYSQKWRRRLFFIAMLCWLYSQGHRLLACVRMHAFVRGNGFFLTLIAFALLRSLPCLGQEPPLDVIGVVDRGQRRSRMCLIHSWDSVSDEPDRTKPFWRPPSTENANWCDLQVNGRRLRYIFLDTKLCEIFEAWVDAVRRRTTTEQTDTSFSDDQFFSFFGFSGLMLDHPTGQATLLTPAKNIFSNGHFWLKMRREWSNYILRIERRTRPA